MCPDMVLLDTAANPHRAPLELWRDMPDVMLDIVVSTALTHQVIRSQAGPAPDSSAPGIRRHRMSSFHGPSMPVIYKHRQRTLKAVNAELSNEDTRYGDLVLWAVITLMSVEVPSPWPGGDAVEVVGC